MKLYFAPGACSLAPHIALREAGLSFELDRLDWATRKTDSGEDFTQVNPKGYVPALRLDDGSVLTEVGVLLQYVADQKPESNLAPKAGTMERYRVMEWLNFISTEIHKNFSPLFNAKASEDWKQGVKDNLARRFDLLEAHFSTHAFLMGERFSVADAYLFTVVNWAGMVKLDTSKWPKLGEFMARVYARPQVQEALKAEGLLK